MQTTAFATSTPLPTLRQHTSPTCNALHTKPNRAPTLQRPSFLLGAPLRRQRTSPQSARPTPTMALGRVVVAGGTGFVGKRLVSALQRQGTAVTVLTRSAAAAGGLPAETSVQVWAPDKLTAVGDDWVGWEKALSGADAVINLCGHPVVSRWNEEGKRSILNSRVETTNVLVDAIARLEPAVRPKAFVSTSAIGYYGRSAASTFDEGGSAAQDDFLADVCVQWEKAAMALEQKAPGTRVVIVRTGVVMGVGGGALERMLPAFKFFVGGPIGTGEQWVSWVHIDDLAKIYIKAAETSSMSGAYNGTAPNPVTMLQLSASLAGALKRPNLFPVPAVVLQVVLGDASSIVLEGQRVLPQRLQADGFEFSYPTVDSAMAAVAKEA